MNGWLVYDEENIPRNERFIGFWMLEARRRGVSLALVKTKDIAFGIRGDKPFAFCAGQDGLPGFAVMRTVSPLLSRQLESLGVRVFNDSRVSALCNDKRETHLLLAGRVPMMDTAFADTARFACPFPYPVVVKASHGSGGREVLLARDEAEYSAALAALAPDSAVIQPLCDHPGLDLRVYVIGKKIIQPMLRQSQTDFRSNFGLGGTATPAVLTREQENMTASIIELFDFGLAGVDFINHRGQWLFNEIEDAVGTRMLYMGTGINIVEMYMNHILSRMA
jgi:gamma-F420-2:alpha-L-glutamate ligase